MYVKTISFSIVTAYILMDGIGMLPSFALPTNIFSLLGSDVLYSMGVSQDLYLIGGCKIRSHDLLILEANKQPVVGRPPPRPLLIPC